jgi:hypothetical protein
MGETHDPLNPMQYDDLSTGLNHSCHFCCAHRAFRFSGRHGVCGENERHVPRLGYCSKGNFSFPAKRGLLCGMRTDQ